MDLRPYQDDLLERIADSSVKKKVGQLPTGGGKSAVIEEGIKEASNLVVMAHAEWLIEQLSKRMPGNHQVIKAGAKWDGSKHIVGMVQTIANRLDSIPKPDLLVVDECFPAGTIVDNKKIEDIKKGTILSCGRSVKDIHKNISHKLVRINDLVCTPNHPISTVRGWVRAGEIKIGDFFYVQEDLPELRSKVSKQMECDLLLDRVSGGRAPETVYAYRDMLQLHEDCDWQRKFFSGSAAQRSCLLLGRMQRRNCQENELRANGKDKPPACQPENENEQPDEQRGCAREGIRHTQGKWAQTQNSRREWGGGNESADDFAHCSWMADGTCSDNRLQAALLQNRFSKSRSEDCDRNRRSISRLIESQDGRCEEAELLRAVRVDRIEVLERGRTDVFNLHIEKNHNYLANGVLVHNCHHAVSPTYRKILEAWDGATVVGMTATPRRLDGQGLESVADELICGPQYRDLIDQGYLKPFEVYSVPSNVDLTGVRTIAGEYQKGDVKDAIRKSTIFGDVVDHWKRLGRDGGHASFWSSIEEAEQAAEQVKGWHALHSKLSKDRIRQLIDGLRTGSVESLASVGMIGEGLDVPGLASVSLCRPTKSLTIYLQQSGRCNRGGQGVARVFDHVQNWREHGLPDDDREWSLKGRIAKKRDASGGFSVWDCPECWAVNRSTNETCIACGMDKPREIRITEQVEARLELITAADRKEIHDLCETIEDYKQFAKIHRKPPTWAAYQWAMRDLRIASDGDPFLEAAGTPRPNRKQFFHAAHQMGLNPKYAAIYARQINLVGR